MKATSQKLEQTLANTPSDFELMTELHKYTKSLWQDPKYRALYSAISSRLYNREAK